MNRKQIATMVLLFVFFAFVGIGMEGAATEDRGRWLAAVAVASFFCVAFVLVTDYLFWQFLVRKIDDRLEKLQDLLDRHSRECPVKKEQLLAGCLAVEETGKKGDAFRRTFTAIYPAFLFRLRELVPGITPVEELLCMLIKMNLNSREIADRMSISPGSLHTTRYRFKRKLPLPEGVTMDDWIRQIE